MSNFLPTTFITLALAHFLALVSPGPDFFLIVGHAARHRLRGSLFICIGIALGNAIYIAIAIAGWSAIKQSPVIYRVMELAGAAYLLWMGCMLIRASKHPTSVIVGDTLSLPFAKQFAIGLCSALLNPKNAVFYLTLMTVIIGTDVTLIQQAFAGVWMVLLVFVWDAGLAATIAHPNIQRTLEKKIPFIEMIAGIFLVMLALSFAILPEL